MSDDGDAMDDEAGSGPAEPSRPVLRIVRGDPTPEELAALLAVVGAVTNAGGQAAVPRRPRSAWNDPARTARRPMHPGPAGWARSALPG